MLDLLTPTNHAVAYEWASVFLAHVVIGLAVTAILAAILDTIDRMALNVGDTSAGLVTGLYLVVWEMGLQRVGAGWADALVDTFAVCIGALSGLFLWRRAGVKLAITLAAGIAVLWHGVGARK